MGFFDNPNEQQRLKNLELLEDKRMRFAEKMEKEGFAPEKMLLAGTDRGGVAGISRGYIVFGPDFGGEGEFELVSLDPESIRFEEVSIPGEGMGGVFGFGKRGMWGFSIFVPRDGAEYEIPFVVNRNGCLLVNEKKNPLLSTKRRKGNANVVWDIPPMEKNMIKRVKAALEEIVGRTF